MIDFLRKHKCGVEQMQCCAHALGANFARSSSQSQRTTRRPASRNASVPTAVDGPRAHPLVAGDWPGAASFPALPSAVLGRHCMRSCVSGQQHPRETGCPAQRCNSCSADGQHDCQKVLTTVLKPSCPHRPAHACVLPGRCCKCTHAVSLRGLPGRGLPHLQRGWRG